jgi:hypothetical protein
MSPTRNLAAVALVALMAAVAPASASTQTKMVTVGGTDYTLRTVTGTFDGLAGLLMLDPWWTNTTNGIPAATFSDAAGFAGEPLNGFVGNTAFTPFFAHTDNRAINGTVQFSCGSGCGAAILANVERVWATTAPVAMPDAAIPVPASLPLLAAALGAFGFLRRVLRGRTGRTA